MEAGYRPRCVFLATVALLMLSLSHADAANFRTQNFLIQAPNAQLAQAVGKSAEKFRSELAVHWLGKPLPPWPRPCPIRVISGQLAAQGVTTYNLSPVRDFQMEVVGTPERILDSVLPHEITHTILATHFGRPLPRWADEGICTTVEHVSERNKHEAKLREFLQSRRGIAMNRLFLLTEYPNDVLPMYAQGYSVCRFLIEQQGPQTFINFLHDYMEERSWTANVQKYYGYKSLRELQEYWLAWVSAGSGPVEKFAMLDSARSRSAVEQVGGETPDNSRLALAAATGHPNTKKSASSNTTPSKLTHANGAPVGGAIAALGQSTRDQSSTGRSNQQPEDIGWYSRQREEAVNTLASKSDDDPKVAARNTITPIVPPSIRDSGRYSVSQPQDEQQMSRSGMVLPASPAASRPVYQLMPGQAIRRFR
ncbi:MAG: hypothetical protein WBD20_05970 [Pirellulaceae bacterium]